MQRPTPTVLALAPALAALAALTPPPALADVGYFQLGYGAESRSAGGAAAASTRDAFGGASNPATTVWVGNRMDVGVAVVGGRTTFRRDAGLPGPLTGLLDTSIDYGGSWNALAEVAYSRQLDPELAFSVVGYANGAGVLLPGDNTACPSPAPPPSPPVTGNALCGSGRLGTSLKQYTVAPTLSAKVSSATSIGASLLFTSQQYRAEGLQGFVSQSAQPTAATNRGNDESYGLGIRLGGYWRVNDMLSVGGSWTPRIRMSRLESYAGLLPDGGRLDVPENLLAGLEVTPLPGLSVLLDYQRINYSKVAAFGNRPYDGTVQRGASGGPGLGWKDMDIYKLGLRYEITPRLRASIGMAVNSHAFDAQYVSDNIATPATVRLHQTFGFGWTPSRDTQWSMFYVRATGNAMSGPSVLASSVASGALGTPTTVGTETIRSTVNTLGVQLSLAF